MARNIPSTSRRHPSDLPKTAAPASLWGKDAIHQFDAFDPDTGKRMAIKVTDLGEEVLTLHGVSHQTHHYKIADTLTGEFARDHHRLRFRTLRQLQSHSSVAGSGR
jgi:hypothetical protein